MTGRSSIVNDTNCNVVPDGPNMSTGKKYNNIKAPFYPNCNAVIHTEQETRVTLFNVWKGSSYCTKLKENGVRGATTRVRMTRDRLQAESKRGTRLPKAAIRITLRI